MDGRDRIGELPGGVGSSQMSTLLPGDISRGSRTEFVAPGVVEGLRPLATETFIHVMKEFIDRDRHRVSRLLG
jgi:hypothetical protein